MAKTKEQIINNPTWTWDPEYGWSPFEPTTHSENRRFENDAESKPIFISEFTKPLFTKHQTPTTIGFRFGSKSNKNG